MARGVAVLFAALALLAVLAAGFGAEAARAEGSIWDRAETISSGYTVSADGFVLIGHYYNDAIVTAKITTATGSSYIVASSGHSDHAFRAENGTWTIPVSEGDTITFTSSGTPSINSYFVPSGGAAVDDRVIAY